ncbi:MULTISPECIES: MerR family transcriptional regulator [Pseudovibrio]|uniref:MerR family transcriptional regulator n=1 Tax=Stappiaceae TaxID=2821832 RepID=UPI002365DD9F|nr:MULTISPECIES: MerR family transcriptional regulator [Pseudovibrio]MDD7908400.1 MerR family transcriptional regulator [Pseudovibrio exalbescens]MDX5592526.1 MerR family transcriptional regulator [Pseudovibrio sp. SPO723]
MQKSADAFRTISEVAEHLDLPQHVLRFWETRFTQIKPLKRGGGRRYYRPEDVELLAGIRHLLYGEGYTIKGVQRILREQGARFVMDIGQNPDVHSAVGIAGLQQASDEGEEQTYQPVAAQREPVYTAPEPENNEPNDDDLFFEREEQAGAAGTYAEQQEEDEPLPAGLLPDDDQSDTPSHAPTALKFMDRLRGGQREPSDDPGNMTKEEIRLLQSTLFELLECKRMLDQTR